MKGTDMARYRVPMSNTVWHYKVVEADSVEQAAEEAETAGLPGVMMLDHTYPDEDGWTVDEANIEVEL